MLAAISAVGKGFREKIAGEIGKLRHRKMKAGAWFGYD